MDQTETEIVDMEYSTKVQLPCSPLAWLVETSTQVRSWELYLNDF